MAESWPINAGCSKFLAHSDLTSAGVNLNLAPGEAAPPQKADARMIHKEVCVRVRIAQRGVRCLCRGGVRL